MAGHTFVKCREAEHRYREVSLNAMAVTSCEGTHTLIQRNVPPKLAHTTNLTSPCENVVSRVAFWTAIKVMVPSLAPQPST